MTKSKITAGFYQISAGELGYGNIHKKDDGKWHADIRKPTGELRRFAGIWNTFKEAREEVEYLIPRA